MTDQQPEIAWKPVACAPDYFVSSAGELRRAGRMIKGYRLRAGYVGCTVSMNGKRRSTTIHALVAETFVPNPEGKPEVNHKNGIKDDNRAENLEWVTRSENAIHSLDVLGNRAKLQARKKKLWQPPPLRRRITIEDFDGPEAVTHVIELHRTNRIDTYRATVDGHDWQPRIGWSRVLDGLRKALPRLASIRKMEA